eukprot:GHVS01074889.1.p1 GENE.GHVS01074889.1~~GHVS01074889.1.p1  ORF type:complete len:436 (-),score=10.33 GHVS01074889.1:207-1514(-)
MFMTRIGKVLLHQEIPGAESQGGSGEERPHPETTRGGGQIRPGKVQGDDGSDGNCGKVQGDDEKAEASFRSTLQWVGGRAEVGLPWKVPRPGPIADTYGLAMGRLRTFGKKYDPRSEEFKMYSKQIEQWKEAGMIENAPKKVEGQEYIIQHQIVLTAGGRKITRERQRFVTIGMKTKGRVVFDASATNKGGISLNEALYRGPVLLWSIPRLIIRASLSRVEVIGDITKAYLQIGIRPQDRDVLRFLWFVDPREGFRDGNVCMMPFTRCPFGIICGSYLLAAVIRELCRTQDTPAMISTATALASDIYVDNLQHGGRDTKEVCDFYGKSGEILGRAGMQICGWRSNDDMFNRSIPPTELGEERVQKMLGMLWDTREDQLTVRAPFGAEVKSTYTKKQVLSILNGVYDPVGLVLPAVVQGRLLYSTVPEYAKTWDCP